MELKGKVALFPCGKTMIDIVDIATGEVVRQHDVESTIGSSASVQRNIAAMAVDSPQPGIHVMDIKSGMIFSSSFFLISRMPESHSARMHSILWRGLAQV